MGIVERVGGWFGLEKREVARETDPRWIPLVDSSVGGSSPRAAERIAAVHACIDVIASALAALPPVVRERATSRPVNSSIDAVLRRPNPWQSWPDFVQWYISQCLLHGNALAVVEDNGSLTPIPWTSITLSQDAAGRLAYRFSRPSVGGPQPPRFSRPSVGDPHRPDRVVPADSVLHMRDRSDDGLVGVSRLRRSGDAVAQARIVGEAANAMYSNGVTPSGAISVEGRLTPAQRQSLREELVEEYGGASQAGKVLLLDQAARWSSIDATARDSELLESRRFSVVEICRLFEVPPPLVQDYQHNTFTNASIAGKWFAQFTLAGWAAKFEAVFSQLLPSTRRLELDMSAFTRADVGERWNAYDIALRHGVVDPQTIKDMEGW